MYEYHDINYPNNIYPVEHDNFYGGDEYEENDHDHEDGDCYND